MSCKYKFGQEVQVISGFFEGLKGTLVNFTAEAYEVKPTPEAAVRFGYDTVWIDEYDLQASPLDDSSSFLPTLQQSYDEQDAD